MLPDFYVLSNHHKPVLTLILSGEPLSLYGLLYAPFLNACLFSPPKRL